MNRVIMFLMNQKLLVNLVVALILILGLTVLMRINREFVPEVNFDMVTVTTIYPGGSPDELEQLISIPIEKELREVDGLDKVRAYNIENVSVVAIYIDDSAKDKKQVVQDIKDAVDLVENLPDKAEKPIVEEVKLEKSMVIDVAIYGSDGSVPYGTIREVADDFEDSVYELDEIAEVEDFGFLDREYLVEVDPSAQMKYRMGMNTVINTLATRNLDLPGGPLRLGDREYVLRTKGQYNDSGEILGTVLMSNDMGFVTRIRDVATVSDTFEEATVHQRYNGQEAIIYRLWKKRSVDEIVTVDKIRDFVAHYKNKYPDQVKIQLFNDYSKMTRERISAVLSNAVTGFILLAIILTMLLGPRMAAIVASGIPIAFMVAFMGMKAGDITLNVISLFGMIMVLGMIVDFSIVVSENSHRYMETGLFKDHAIQKGVSEVVWPVTVTLICTCAAFAPLLMLTGLMGKFIKAIPMVLILCLCASWFTAMFVMPTYLQIFSKEPKIKTKFDELKSEDRYFEKGFFGFIQRRYKKLLAVALDHRYVTLGVLIALLAGSLALVRVIGFVFMPGGGAEQLEIKTYLPQDTNLAANLRESRKIEDIIMKLPKAEFEALHSSIGEEVPFVLDPKPGEGTHKSTFKIYLTSFHDREREAREILDELRVKITGAQKKGLISPNMFVRFSVEEKGPPVGKPVNVEIRGRDLAVLGKIAHEYMDYLRTIDGVRDITMDLEEGKEEYRYKVDEVMATRAGLSTYDVAMALHSSYQGAIATSVRKGEEDIDIRVRFPEEARKNRKSLDYVMIANRSGGLIPLDRVSSMTKQPGYSQINRLNYMRLVQVQADVDLNKATSIEVNRAVEKKFRDISARYPGYSVAYGGEQEETSERMGELGTLFQFALLIIFIVLAVFFGSLMLPVVVMAAIPFALVGVIFALAVHGEPLSFMSVLGLFSLAGVIVSNTLVLVQFINNLRDEHLPMREALIEAGVIRLRPIILTSGTTVLGLIPSIYGLGGKDFFVAPLALSFGYGLVFATVITLILIPCFYHIAEDIKGRTSRLLAVAGITMSPAIYTPPPAPVLPGIQRSEEEGGDVKASKKEKKKKKQD
ncbi:MAG TPA: efflux RND transporter permease subunit [Spirochaetota bacterium]|nr:efflux RND transporter permease subunit [Spirochaetota bacterium]HSA14005.1 efflux RND transporter permease subunit [Spirochaetota bacterium]